MNLYSPPTKPNQSLIRAIPKQMKESRITVSRSARFYTLGTPSPDIEEVWFVLHGYGQLASYFIRHFRPLDNGKRLIVAPEALNRFYLGENEQFGRRVGATWMTREDREMEINDYLGYLNQVADHALDAVGRRTPITVLGFSQGAITATRWVTMGRLPAKRFIVWGGHIPHDLDLDAHRPTLNSLDLHVVVGDDDYWITPERVEKERKRLDDHQIEYTYYPYEGEHRIPPEVFEAFLREIGVGT